MLRRRVIPCLDVRGGRLVKGINFESLRDCGDPVDAARRYADAGADEIVWLNISAGEERWPELLAAVERAAERVDVPLCVGGGVSSTEQARQLLLAGADKVSVNTAALDEPELVTELADRFGTQCVVVAIDAARSNGGWEAHAAAGRRPTGRDAVGWASEAAERGAGELLVTSIDSDGTGSGYDVDLLATVCDAVTVPVIASGGAGGPSDLVRALEAGASAALAASIFHDGTHSIAEVKREVAACGLPVRI
ncbi:MAG TPA: imidazole glycerol phosphate synthase subunit HisF [Gaiellales bacterium]|nr:imidazole glycerol phosphate synthase subunit HisF [Gaiellales bacterium]